jgi:acyl dehydratase
MAAGADPPPAPAVLRGRWFDELPVGLRIDHAIRRTVTETDNVLFTTMTMNTQPLHLDAQFAEQTEFGRPLVNSLFTLGLVVGLTVTELSLGTTVANLGFKEIVFPAPVFAGDTLRAQSTVLDARPSTSRPDDGVVTFEHVGLNQRDDVVVRAVRTALMRRAPRAAGGLADAR